MFVSVTFVLQDVTPVFIIAYHNIAVGYILFEYPGERGVNLE